ncbi:MAG: HDIG domain-containing protein [Christensenellaceae bacterium]|nr:HDIG domain-containing protein [Christensenellaceae bacterium]
MQRREQKRGAGTRRLKEPQTLYSVLLLTLCFAMIFGALLLLVTPEQHDLVVGELAPKTIKATKDVEDKIATERERERQKNSIIEPIIKTDPHISDRAATKANEILDGLRRIRGEYAVAAMASPTPIPLTPQPSTDEAGETPADGATPESTASPAPTQAPMPTLPPEERYLEAMVGEFSALGLSEYEMRAVLGAEPAAFEHMAEALTTLLSDVMERGVGAGSLEITLDNLALDLAKQGVASQLVGPANAILRQCVEENAFIDEVATEAMRSQLAGAVEPVIYKKGQNIVQDGEIVTEQQYRMIEALGLIRSGRQDFNLYLGFGLFMLTLYFVTLLYMLQYEKQMLRRPKIVLLLCLIILLQLLFAWLVKLSGVQSFFTPVHVAALLITVLVGPRLSLFMNLIIGLFVGAIVTGAEGLMAGAMFEILLMSALTGSLAVFLGRKMLRRSALMYCGILLGLADALVVFTVGLLVDTNLIETLLAAAWALGGGVLSALLTLAFLPLLESAFNLITPQMLLELSTPTQPLLRQLQTEAPGTYYHSLMVANLAEAAAERIGANALLCRVGAYYHDIGKTRRAIFFKENQRDQPNPHDGMEPKVSANILVNHVRDGLVMGEKAKLPQRIRDMIAQHHGTDMMAFFYYKAKEASKEGGELVDPADYRYDGPRPQSKEAVILMLADTTEAATRTLKDRAPEVVSAFIHKLVQAKFENGQFAEAPITFRDLGEIEDSFVKTLTGIYHERIQYPSQLQGGEGGETPAEPSPEKA